MRRTSEGCLSSSARTTRRDYGGGRAGPAPGATPGHRLVTAAERADVHATGSPSRASPSCPAHFTSPGELMLVLRRLLLAAAVAALLCSVAFVAGYAIKD